MSTNTDTTQTRAFVQAAMRRPKTIGAVAPSSAGLAELLARIVPTTGSPTVVELGPGAGAVSAVIARRMPAQGRHIAVELDPLLASYLRATRPEMTVLEGDAMELDHLLDGAGVATVDAVVSGLPWALFTADKQGETLRRIASVLDPAGAFTTFGYLHAGGLGAARTFRRLVADTFDEVIVTRTIWRNIFPARVYVCRRPVSRAGARRIRFRSEPASDT